MIWREHPPSPHHRPFGFAMSAGRGVITTWFRRPCRSNNHGVATGLDMTEILQTLSTAEFRRLPPHDWGAEPKRFGTTRLGLAPFHPANSLFGETNSLFGLGIGCKLLNPLGDRLPKPPNEAGIVRNFQKFPVNFPALREFAAVGNECIGWRQASDGRTTSRLPRPSPSPSSGRAGAGPFHGSDLRPAPPQAGED